MSTSVAVACLALVALCSLHLAAARPVQPDLCLCTREFFPVCAEGRTFGNACVAQCNGYTKDTWVVGECGKCICKQEFAPVCAKGKTFGNACVARCNGYLKFTKGVCRPPKLSLCTTIYNPVCYEGKTYGNACVAKCAGVKKWVDGTCGKQCGCHKIYRPVCAKGKTFSNSCLAKCNGYLTYTKGTCPPPPIKCDPDSALVKCAGDICAASDSPCAKNPAVSCLINPCSKTTYLGTKLTGLQCTPIYVHKTKLKVVTNCNKPLPPLVCAPGSPTAKCKGDPCELTTSPCKGDRKYVCLGNSCGKLTYLGTTLKDAMCTAIFVDPLTRTVAKQCIVK